MKHAADTSRTRRKNLVREWVHTMHLELLRVPIMVPIWWSGMKLCDIAWNAKH